MPDHPTNEDATNEDATNEDSLTRRAVLKNGAMLGGGIVVGQLVLTGCDGLTDDTDGSASNDSRAVAVKLRVNGSAHELDVDIRRSLLDALREDLGLTGSKKGCDHGQCGACTVLVNGIRINSCLTLAVMLEGDEITTIEGLSAGDDLHPMQAAFLARDGFQCGYCTSGQICSAIGMLGEIEAGWPSHVTDMQAPAQPVGDDDIRERMSGNICRCAAYPNIVAAIRGVVEGSAK